MGGLLGLHEANGEDCEQLLRRTVHSGSVGSTSQDCEVSTLVSAARRFAIDTPFRYHGWQDEPENLRGLLLSEASDGNLQQYLEANHDILPLPTKKKWCRQAVESVSHIHRHGVIHSDLRPENYLVHATTPTSLDLWLCDFGGSTCEKLGVDGKQLPDPGFFDPNADWVATTAIDLFSVGSVLYSIVSGHWPHRDPGPFKSAEDCLSYDELVEDHFRNRKYPDVNGIFGGSIILGCWTGNYSSADDVLQALEQEIEICATVDSE